MTDSGPGTGTGRLEGRLDLAFDVKPHAFDPMTAPELFEEREKEKPFVQAHVARPVHPHGGGAHPAKGPWKKTHNKVNRGQGSR